MFFKATLFLRSVVAGMVIWALLTGMEREDWVTGLCAALMFATLLRFSLKSSSWIRLAELPGFTVFFICQSVIAGLHVASVALGPSRNISPGWIELPARLSPGPPRALFSNMISLLPGSLCGNLDENGVHHVHLLSTGKNPVPGLRKLECRIGRLFGIRLVSVTQ